MKLTAKKQVNALAFLLACVYMVSYITRINYGAIISAMVIDTGISKSLLSMALTGSFVTYGAGQIVSGILGDKFSPKKLVTFGLSVTVLTNLLIPVFINPYFMTAVWCVNGFAQSFMWPPMVRLMSALLSEEDYKLASAKVSWGSSFGTIIIYLISPVIISLLSWKWVFVFSAVCGIVMIAVWIKFSYEIEPAKKERGASDKKTLKLLFCPIMIFVMISIILQGMLRDGVTTWMPSYISETYNISSIISILTGVILPIFSIVCFQVSTKLHIKKFKNPLSCASVFFAVGALSAMGLYLLSGQNAAFSVVFSAVITGCMHGVNLMLICMIPPYFKKHGNVSTVSGVVNSCTYIGSAISTYGIAVLSENIGWSFTILVWFIIALAGTVICFGCVKPFKNKFM